MDKGHMETVNRSFERQAGKFESSGYHLSKKEYTDYLLRQVAGTAADTVLEVAAGTAICGRALAPFVKMVVCIDATSAMLNVAKQHAAEENIQNMEFVEGLAEALPFAGGSFDIVITRLAFHHFADSAAPFAEMKRVLKPGGRLVIWDMEAADEELRGENDRIEKLRDPSHNVILSRAEFLDMYGEDFDMQLVETRRVPVELAGWMELTDTPAGARAEIISLMEQDMAGEPRTGLFPYLKDGRIYFDHRWLLLIGIKK